MGKTEQVGRRFAVGRLLSAILVLSISPRISWTQTRLPSPADQAAPQSRRTHLILKDGSYQLVMSYKVVGDRVRYVSAERGGATEEIPLRLIDLDATRRWEQQHDPNSSEPAAAATLDPELAREEADRAALTPTVATDLSLPEQDSVLALDTYQGTAELVPLAQTQSDLNPNTAHNVLRGVLNPLASSHQIVQLRGISAAVQLHVDTPVLYLRLGDDSSAAITGTSMTVDTHGAGGDAHSAPTGGAPTSSYVIVRTDVRTDARIVTSFNINLLGTVRQQEEVVKTNTEILPGGHWMKLTSAQPLTFGEYALMEVLSPKEVNLGVWDFGIHPTAPENRDVIKPQPKRRITLEHRRPN